MQLDTFNDKWAFIAVAMVQTKDLRPKGFPRILGSNFFLIGYRVFVRFKNNMGKNLRGLYILKSETDKKKMELFGNIFTRYKYTTTDIRQTKQDGTIEITSAGSDFKLLIENSDNEHISLPEGSPFSDWKESRKFAGPLPFTFSYNPKKDRVLIIQGMRGNWNPNPVRVLEYKFSFIDKMRLHDIKLANAFIIKDIPYYWKKGKIEKWRP